MADTHPVPVDAPFDLTFVGAGISTAFTLRSVLATYDEEQKQTCRIAIVDPSPDHFAGIAYGIRSGPTARIITTLDEFLAPPELDDFVGWLRHNADAALDACRRAGGTQSSRWLELHRADIEQGRCGHLYLPRRLFGAYVGARLAEAIADAESCGATIVLVEDSVDRIDRDGDRFSLSTRHHGRVTSRRVVLAVGTPMRAPLFDGIDLGPGTLLIEDPYERGLADSVATVSDHVQRIDGRPPRIVIVGANATMLDLLYQFEDDPAVAESTPTYCVVSPRGVLPPRAGQTRGRTPTLPHLDALESLPEIKAHDVLRAVLDDLAHHGAPAEEVAWLIPSVNDAIGRIIGHLDADEKTVFANSVGTEIGRFQRRAGDDYSQVVDDLDAEGRIERVRGRFDELMATRAGDQADVIINATGSAGLAPGVSPLLDSLVGAGLATPTPSNAGFVVDDDYAASPGFFVMGPLLAGNVLDGRPVWHLEHAGRIIEMGTALGRRIGQNPL